ncbi:HxlR family transcriptional regulator [Kribbella pratensis]|uniref:HxlR family transcriptional regulator n=1 Tax=Kribbella pratensis TaxID=2512112 RepID=A0ABY2FMY7_9ACTN|nr:helix-turn-helix domain-containing protein [Kribbella pratensis]TDW94506.1 HxlR family transcriptional regulator [Kribbella pratensis]
MDAMLLPANKTCPIAGALAVLGQKWNLLLLREAFVGSTRFAEFQRIGIPTATLGARLEVLVEAGLLERQAYQEEGERTREEYRLTQAGRDALPILAALAQWGETHLDLGARPKVGFVSVSSGSSAHLEFVDENGKLVKADNVRVERAA